jgi:hypothetical protein
VLRSDRSIATREGTLRSQGRSHLPMGAVLPIVIIDSAIEDLATWNRQHESVCPRYVAHGSSLERCG